MNPKNATLLSFCGIVPQPPFAGEVFYKFPDGSDGRAPDLYSDPTAQETYLYPVLREKGLEHSVRYDRYLKTYLADIGSLVLSTSVRNPSPSIALAEAVIAYLERMK